MKNSIEKKRYIKRQYVLLGVLLGLLFLLQGADVFPRVYGVSPVLLVPFTALCGALFGEYVGCGFGLAAGLLCDVCLTPSLCFNLLVLTFIGCACGLTVKNLTAKTFLPAFLLTVLSCGIYFTLYFAVYELLLSDSSVYYLYRFAMPSALYSLLFIIPLYPVMKFLIRR